MYQVDGAKVGHTRLSFVDLEVPVAGIPITVVRTYDSRVQEQRDFSIGWSLQVRQGSYQHNREPGNGWQIVKATGPFGLPCQVLQETLFHTRSATPVCRSSISRFPLRAFQSPSSELTTAGSESRATSGSGGVSQVRQGYYQSNRDPGSGWRIAPASGPFGLPCQVVQENLFHVTQVWLSDREVYTFKLDLTHPAASLAAASPMRVSCSSAALLPVRRSKRWMAPR